MREIEVEGEVTGCREMAAALREIEEEKRRDSEDEREELYLKEFKEVAEELLERTKE